MTGQNPLQFILYWWRKLLHNGLQKLLSLLLAFACWYMATEDRRATIQQRYDVPVNVRDNTHAGEKRAVSGLTPDHIQVTLTGPRQRLSSVNAADISAYIDVTGTPEGPFSHSIHVDVPDNTHAAKVEPKTAQGLLDAQRKRTFPVTVALTGLSSPSAHYQSTPLSVSVTGPSRLVSSVAQVVTAPAEMRAGEQRPAHLLALDAQGLPVEVSIQPAQVTVSRSDRATLPIRNLPLQLQGQPSNLKVTVLSVEPASVRVLGTPGLLGPLSSVPAQIPYHLGEYAAHPSYQLPAGVYVLDDATVRVRVETAQ